MADVDLTGKVMVPVWHLFDKVGERWLRENPHGFGWTADVGEATPYWTGDDAVVALGRAGGDVRLYAMMAYVDPE